MREEGGGSYFATKSKLEVIRNVRKTWQVKLGCKMWNFSPVKLKNSFIDEDQYSLLMKHFILHYLKWNKIILSCWSRYLQTYSYCTFFTFCAFTFFNSHKSKNEMKTHKQVIFKILYSAKFIILSKHILL